MRKKTPKEKALKQLKSKKDINEYADIYYPMNEIDDALDIAIKAERDKVITELLKKNSSYPVSDVRMEVERLIKELSANSTEREGEKHE